MKYYEWKWKEWNSRRRLNKLHRLVAGTLYTSLTSRGGQAPTSLLLDWTSGLVADLSWVLVQTQNGDGIRYVELALDQLEHQTGISRLLVLGILMDLQHVLERNIKSTRTEPYFALWTTSKNTHLLPLRAQAGMPQRMQ